LACTQRLSRALVLPAVITVWAVAAVGGICILERYAGAAGNAANAQPSFPSGSAVSRNNALPRLVMFLHPKCPCSRASVGELNRLMARYQGRVNVTVMMTRPEGAADGWEHTDLHRAADAIPEVTVRTDVDGHESRRFGAATSGQVFLYSGNGELLFSGGITAARGHNGDNAGRAAIEAILDSLASAGRPQNTAVFGCPLFDDTCRAE
jgi:hypothetical protein